MLALFFLVIGFFCLVSLPLILTSSKPSPKNKLNSEIKDLYKKIGLRMPVLSYLRDTGKTDAYEKLLDEIAKIHLEIVDKQRKLEELKK